MKTTLLIGASSAVAKEVAKALFAKNERVISISRNEPDAPFTEFYEYTLNGETSFPKLEGTIDGLVYFPGTINLKPFHRLTQDEFQTDFEINVAGAIATIQKYLPNLKLAQDPAVVLFSSVAAQTGIPFHSSISISKGAIESLTKSLAAEYAPTIRFNAIALSLTHTPLAEKFLSTPEKLEASRQRNPMKKVGTPSEIAEFVSFLLNNATWMTGEILHIDGGISSTRSI